MTNTGANTPRRQSLRGEFLRVTIPLIFISVIGVFSVIELIAHRNAVDRMEQGLASMVRTQATALANPLWNLDDEQIRLSLEAAATNREILSARVIGEDGEVIGEAGSVPEDASADDLVSLGREIFFDAGAGPKKIGKVEFVATRRFVWEQTLSRLYTAAIIALVAVTIEVGAALFALRTIIGRPLDKLLASINLARERGERQRVVWDSTNELGQVISSYNEMQTTQQCAPVPGWTTPLKLSRRDFRSTTPKTNWLSRIRDTVKYSVFGILKTYSPARNSRPFFELLLRVD